MAFSLNLVSSDSDHDDGKLRGQETQTPLGPDNIAKLPILQRSWVYTKQIILEGPSGPHSPGIAKMLLSERP